MSDHAAAHLQIVRAPTTCSTYLPSIPAQQRLAMQAFTAYPRYNDPVPLNPRASSFVPAIDQPGGSVTAGAAGQQSQDQYGAVPQGSGTGILNHQGIYGHQAQGSGAGILNHQGVHGHQGNLGVYGSPHFSGAYGVPGSSRVFGRYGQPLVSYQQYQNAATYSTNTSRSYHGTALIASNSNYPEPIAGGDTSVPRSGPMNPAGNAQYGGCNGHYVGEGSCETCRAAASCAAVGHEVRKFCWHCMFAG